ncbi:MAG: arginase family protein [Cruoricaptor ignavus]|nr:arginase family protein [Cruoricaptor ignavus]
MDLQDFVSFPHQIKTEPWQLGSKLKNQLPQNGVALLFVSDNRGTNGKADMADFTGIREQLYRLSGSDLDIPIFDIGDLVSGKTQDDTHYILQEILTTCHQKNTIPVVLGGSNDLSYSLFSALNFLQKGINYTQISNVVWLNNDSGQLNEKNFLSHIFSSKQFTINNYHHLGYQKHLNEMDSVQLVKDVDFDVVRLAEMMGNMNRIEPFFRRADLVTINADAIESFAGAFSLNPQVNGLNRREICACMKEIGLGQNLKSVGIFNLNLETQNPLNHQLLVQMIWYLLEGISIQNSHPKERNYETFWVLVDDMQFAFKRETFSGLWYFGEDENIENCLPCAQDDYEQAKRGFLNKRLQKK